METGLDSLAVNKDKIMQYRDVIISGVFILVSLGLIVFIAYPKYQEYNKTKEEIKTNESKVSELDTKISSLEEISQIQSQIDNNIELSKEAVPAESEIPIVMAMVQNISADSGVKLSGLSYAGSNNASEDSENNQSTSSFNLSLSVSGSYSSILNYLKNLENSRRLLDVQQFGASLDRSQEDQFSNTVTSQLTLTSYYADFPGVSDVSKISSYTDLINVLNSMEMPSAEIDESVNQSPFSRFNQTEDSDEESDNDAETTSQDDLEGSSEPQSGSSEGVPVNTLETEEENGSTENQEAEEQDLSEVFQQVQEEEGL